VPVKEGEILKTHISKITKGERGTPGELGGSINYNDDNIIGDISVNNTLGIYGTVNDHVLSYVDCDPIPIAFQDEVVEGEGVILAQLDGGEVKSYRVYIQKVAKYSSEASKGMIIKILDEDLLALTNGIVQGMSGSPIIQNGKLIGAVTHVFVQDPTKGYGIFIENMLNSEK
jgi:stage IV sporulation protein B